MGRGLPKDPVLAYMWYYLAFIVGDASKGFPACTRVKITVKQIAQARHLATVWLQAHDQTEQPAPELPLPGTEAKAPDLRLGFFLLGKRKYKEALRHLVPLAKQGNVAAQTRLAFLYKKGWPYVKKEPLQGCQMVHRGREIRPCLCPIQTRPHVSERQWCERRTRSHKMAHASGNTRVNTFPSGVERFIWERRSYPSRQDSILNVV